MDFRGIELIEKMDYEGFWAYLQETKNKICGRHSICVLLNVLKASQTKCGMQFLDYSQSNTVKKYNETSVSYAAIACYMSK